MLFEMFLFSMKFLWKFNVRFERATVIGRFGRRASVGVATEQNIKLINDGRDH